MFIGLVTVLPFTIGLMFVIKDIDAVTAAHLPSLEAFYQATGSKTTAVALQVVLTILYYSACAPKHNHC